MIRRRKAHLYTPFARQTGGFTLIEVLVALTIFALAGVSLIEITGTQARHQQRMENQLAAAWVAENALADLRLSGMSVARNANGKAEMGGQTYYWQLQAGEGGSRVHPIRVEVRLAPTDPSPIAHLDTWVH